MNPTQPPAAPPSNDDNRTVLLSGGSSSSEAGGNMLPVGYQLQEYVVEGLIGEGGFGIVYLARDTQLGRVVALKEYMPATLATRVGDLQVAVRSVRHRETFELGLRSFVNEARLLASFENPSLVKVYRFWEQNGTAYMVMPFYEGPTLKQWLAEHALAPNEDWLLSVLYPLIDALELMHHENCYHRDISPDNILLLKQQVTQLGSARVMRPVLLDFGAARKVIVDATQVLTVILKPGYAPVEQYAESAAVKQGPWTDVYALCAVLYTAVTGRVPMPSVSRMVSDDMESAQQAGKGQYSVPFLKAIDLGLSVRPELRPQDMAALRTLIDASPRAQALGLSGIAPVPVTDAGSAPTVALPRAPVAAVLPVSAPMAAVPATTRQPLHAARFLIAGALVLALVGAWWWSAQREKVESPDAVVTLMGASPEAPVASAPAIGLEASQTPADVQAPLQPASPTRAGEPAPAAGPFSIASALQDIVLHADPLMSVNALADKSVITIGRDQLQFRVKSSEAGYLYVFLGGTDKSHFYLLFPNGLDKHNRIEANREVILPRAGWRIAAGGPKGVNHIVALVSRVPRDLAGAGFGKSVDNIPVFDLQVAEQLWQQRRTSQSPFVGQPVCEAGEACDPRYGATLLEIEEVEPAVR